MHRHHKGNTMSILTRLASTVGSIAATAIIVMAGSGAI